MKLDALDIRAVANGYAAQLQLCRPHGPAAHSMAQKIHAQLIASGFKPRGHIINCLIGIYSKCSNLEYARKVFDGIPQPDVVARTTLIAAYSSSGDLKSAQAMFRGIPLGMRDTISYNAIITACCHNQDGHHAVDLFREMQRRGLVVDDFTFTSTLGAVALVADREEQCQQMHCMVVKSGTGSVTSVSNALVCVYVKCASSPLVSSQSLISSARKLFDEMHMRDELTWTTMISGYVKNGNLDSARELLDGMTEKLQVSWNAMISGYVQHTRYQEALELLRKMHSLKIRIDEFALTSIIKACANAGLFNNGKEVQAYIMKNEPNPMPDFSLSVNNSLISLYWKCGKSDAASRIFCLMPSRDIVSSNTMLSGYIDTGKIEEARSFFHAMQERNLRTWTMMISAFAQNNFPEEGLKLFNQMRIRGFEPCDYSFAGAITSCAVLGSLEQGIQIHSQVIKLGHDSSLSAGNSLITMYARCGVVEDSNRVFLTMPYLDAVSMNAMVAAFGQHGRGSQAVELFEHMLVEKIELDRISFLTILSACSHAGLVEEGQRYFNSMETRFGITPG